MAQYAQFDPAAKAPAPVTGWYDTAHFDYPNLPELPNLIEVSADQWALHFQDPNGWVVDNRQLTQRHE